MQGVMHQLQQEVETNSRSVGAVYCWRPSWSSRFESMWSLLQKFAFLNSARIPDIQHAFGREPWSKNIGWPENRRDLRVLGHFDISKLSLALQLDRQQINESFPAHFVKPSELPLVVSNSLRYCPKCIEKGYHSSIHQLIFITHCPIHEAKLLEECINCGNPSPYAADSASFEIPYGCKCSNRFWNEISYRKSIKPFTASENIQMLNLSEWLLKRATEPMYESSIKSFKSYLYKRGRFSNHRFIIERWLNGLPIRCGTVIGTPPPLYQSFSKAEIHGKAAYWRCFNSINPSKEFDHKKTIKYSFYDHKGPLYKELYATYKSIHRHLRSKHLKKHIHCFNELCRDVTWKIEDWLHGSTAVCEHAYALILWRMYWENISVPRHLLLAPINLSRNCIFDYESKMDIEASRVMNNLDTQRNELYLWLILHFFTMECLEVYKECIFLAKLMKRNNCFTWKVTDISGLYKGHWIIRDEENGRAIELHWWLNHSYKDFMKATKTPIKKHLGNEVHPLPFISRPSPK